MELGVLTIEVWLIETEESNEEGEDAEMGFDVESEFVVGLLS